MLDIIVNNEAVDVADDIAISLQFNNPMFEFNNTNNSVSFSYPFTLPTTAKNKRIFAFAELVENTAAIPQSIPAYITMSNIRIATGAIRVREAGKYYQCELYFDNAAQNKTLNSKLLSDLTFGDIVLNNADAYGTYDANDSIVLSYPEANWVAFPIWNPTFYGDLNADYLEYMNHWNPSAGYFMYNRTMGADVGLSRKYTVVPQLYLHFVMDKIAEYIGYSISGTFFSDEEINSLIIANTFSSDFEDTPFAYLLNLYQRKSDGNVRVPKIAILDAINSLKKLFCLYMNFNENTRKWQITPIKEILAARSIVSPEITFESTYTILPVEYKGFTFSQKPNVADAVYYSTKPPTGSPINAQATTLADLYAITPDADGEFRLVISQNKYFYGPSTDAGAVSGWVEFSDRLQDLVVDDGETKIDSDFGTLPMRRAVASFPGWADREWLTPQLEAMGSSSMYGLGFNEFDARLLFYRGISTEELGNDYPLASSNNYDYDENVLGNYTLSWHGGTGLYEVWWKPFVEFMKTTKLVRRRAVITPNFLSNMDWATKYHYNNQDYLLKSIRVSLYKTRIGMAEIEKYKV